MFYKTTFLQEAILRRGMQLFCTYFPVPKYWAVDLIEQGAGKICLNFLIKKDG